MPGWSSPATSTRGTGAADRFAAALAMAGSEHAARCSPVPRSSGGSAIAATAVLASPARRRRPRCGRGPAPASPARPRRSSRGSPIAAALSRPWSSHARPGRRWRRRPRKELGTACRGGEPGAELRLGSSRCWPATSAAPRAWRLSCALPSAAVLASPSGPSATDAAGGAGGVTHCCGLAMAGAPSAPVDTRVRPQDLPSLPRDRPSVPRARLGAGAISILAVQGHAVRLYKST